MNRLGHATSPYLLQHADNPVAWGGGSAEAFAEVWREERGGGIQEGRGVVEAVASSQGAGLEPVPGTPSAEVLDSAAAGLVRDHDTTYGGFGGAPKFPPHLAMLFLLRHYQRTGDRAALEVVRHTAEAMARGGIYDQLAGGFARYSVDNRWLVPHFEKMLYDNALLLRVYTQLDRVAGNSTARRVAAETAAFLERDLYDGHGFISALDADTDGVEGLTYVWTPDQIDEVVGEIDSASARYLLQVSNEGTFAEGRSVLHQSAESPDLRA